jgi:hypothetical protein
LIKKRLTGGLQKIQSNRYYSKKKALSVIRHTGESGHRSGGNGPKGLARPHPERIIMQRLNSINRKKRRHSHAKTGHTLSSFPS